MRWMGFSTSQSPAEVMCSVSRSHTDRTCSEIRDRFSTRAEFPQPQPLGLERVRVGGVSASNEIALLLNADAANPTLARAALSGGAPREVLEHVRDATWAPSGDLVIVRMANGRDRLEYPVGKMLYETAGWISHPRFSKKGDRIAFLDHTAFPDTRGTVALVDLSGHKQTLTREWEDVRGLAWSAASRAQCSLPALPARHRIRRPDSAGCGGCSSAHRRPRCRSDPGAGSLLVRFHFPERHFRGWPVDRCRRARRDGRSQLFSRNAQTRRFAAGKAGRGLLGRLLARPQMGRFFRQWPAAESDPSAHRRGGP